MQEESFVPALLDLRHSQTDTVIEKLHTLFAEISRMNPQQVTAAFQTAKCTAESCGLEEDVALRYILSACHQRMVALVNEAGQGASKKLALSFCSLLKVKMDFTHQAEQALADFQK